MADQKILAEQFDACRPRLTAVSYRMLGSLSEAEDAVQEAWLRLGRSDVAAVDNLGGWLTTVVARICLDMLRARKSRREEALDDGTAEALPDRADRIDPEQDLAMADSVGLALLVVLETLTPAERIAFVLHDMFDLPFDEIAPVVGRSPVAARQLASRARRRLHGARAQPATALTEQRRIVDAFLTAARGGDFLALLSVLDPEVEFRADETSAQAGGISRMDGANEVATFFLGKAQAARPAMVEGAVGALVAPGGKLLVVLSFTFRGGRIAGVRSLMDPGRLAGMELAAL